MPSSCLSKPHWGKLLLAASTSATGPVMGREDPRRSAVVLRPHWHGATRSGEALLRRPRPTAPSRQYGELLLTLMHIRQPGGCPYCCVQASDGPHEKFLICLPQDRKSTRLNSSHANISYAV